MFFSYTKTTKNCGYNTNTNHYHDRQSNCQNTMVRFDAVNTNDCRIHVRYLLEISELKRNRSFEPPQLIAFITDLYQQLTSSVFKIRCKLRHWMKIFMVYRLTALNLTIYHGFQALLKNKSRCVKNKILKFVSKLSVRHFEVPNFNSAIFIKNDITVSGRVLPCTYENECCEPTAIFSGLNNWFQTDQ